MWRDSNVEMEQLRLILYLEGDEEEGKRRERERQNKQIRNAQKQFIKKKTN